VVAGKGSVQVEVGSCRVGVQGLLIHID